MWEGGAVRPLTCHALHLKAVPNQHSPNRRTFLWNRSNNKCLNKYCRHGCLTWKTEFLQRNKLVQCSMGGLSCILNPWKKLVDEWCARVHLNTWPWRATRTENRNKRFMNLQNYNNYSLLIYHCYHLNILQSWPFARKMQGNQLSSGYCQCACVWECACVYYIWGA